mgnify:FL=1
MRQRWMVSANDKEKIWRMLEELDWWYARRGQAVVEVDMPELANDAEAFKSAMRCLRPRSRRSWDAVLMKNPAFWNRISLHHLRMLGVRHWFALVHSLDEAHRLLVIKIPPVRFSTFEDKEEHAWRQATYRDDERGEVCAWLASF